MKPTDSKLFNFFNFLNFFLFTYGCVLVVMKLLGHISGSWWLVTMPIYGPIAMLLVSLILFYIGIMVAGKLDVNPRDNEEKTGDSE